MSLIYLIPIILTIVWSIKYDRQEEFDKYKSQRFWFLYFILSIIAGFSYAWGGDKQTYLTEFNYYSSNIADLFSEIEHGFLRRSQMPGWIMVNMFAKTVFDSFYVVQLLESFFINFAIFYTCRKYTQRVFFFVLLYCLSFLYFIFNIEVMREAFALGFCLFAVEMLFRKKYILTVLLFAIALLFHLSAIAMIILFPWMKFRVTMRRLPFALLAALLIWFSCSYLSSFIIDMVVGQEGFWVRKVLLYSSFSTGFIVFIIYTLIYTVAPFFIMHYGIQNGIHDDDIIRRKEYFMAFFICLSLVVPSFLPLARFLNYAMPVLLCLTTDMLYTLLREKKHLIIKISCLFLFWGYSMYHFLAFSPKTETRYLDFWFPYTSIFEEDSYDRTYRHKTHDILTSIKTLDENKQEAK